jgi:hypothetical protein
MQFWKFFEELQAGSPDGGVNKEELRRNKLIASGIDSGSAWQVIKDAVSQGYVEDKEGTTLYLTGKGSKRLKKVMNLIVNASLDIKWG